MNDDIICAIATSRLEAAISIIRISGKGCIDFVQSFFTGNLNKKSQTISYGYIVDGEEKVDEVLISIYRGQHTFIQGNITNFIKDLKEDLIKIITQIEVNIDYPEYEDIEELTAEKLLPGSVSLRKKMDDILDRSKNMHLIKDGISTVIVGKPNVGKSSLLNALLEEDKAIVTDIAGTTRDVVEGSIRLNDIVLNMIDTAGIRETEDKIEHMGVKKSLSLIDQADLVLVVLDGSRPLERQVQLLEKASQSLNVAIQAMEDGIPTDLIVTDLYDSWENLKEILGEQAKEDLLDELFKRFCIGK